MPTAGAYHDKVVWSQVAAGYKYAAVEQLALACSRTKSLSCSRNSVITRFYSMA